MLYIKTLDYTLALFVRGIAIPFGNPSSALTSTVEADSFDIMLYFVLLRKLLHLIDSSIGLILTSLTNGHSKIGPSRGKEEAFHLQT